MALARVHLIRYVREAGRVHSGQFRKLIYLLDFFIHQAKMSLSLNIGIIEEGISEVKIECYAKDKVKSLLFF